MKLYKYILLTFCFAATINVQAQLSTDRNFVSKNEIKKPGITTQAQADALTVDDKMQSVGYFDGLGRLLQNVAVQNSPGRQDVIAPVEYDGYGREVKKFLPYTDLSGVVYGSLHPAAYADQATFYNPSSTLVINIQKDNYPFAQTFYDFSPDSRVKEQGASGQTWQPGSGHTVKPAMSVNTIANDVKQWVIEYMAGSLPVLANLYAPGELFKTITSDERDKQVVEFKDKEGKLILKKVQAADIAGDGPAGWLCTYYVYDDFNQLRFVLPPKATEAYLAGTAISTIADELCFRYEYDYRHRMIIKKVPGAAEVWMVYDARDRLVMMQDGNLRSSGKWLVTVQDLLNRPVQTGLLTDAVTSFATHQSNAASSINYPSTAANFELLSQSYYDDYNWVNGSGTSLTATLESANLSNSNYFITTYNTSPFAMPITGNYIPKGLLTGNKVKVLGSTSQFLYSVVFYDEKGRSIQTQSINISNGKDIATTQYDFSGKPLRSLLEHTKAGSNAQTHTVLTKMDYDHAGRLLLIRKTINSVVSGQAITTPEKTILQNSYDELGQLKTKKLGNRPNSVTELETLSYDYNIRGWLLGINRGYISGTTPPSGTGSPYFGFELAYDKTTASAASVVPGAVYAAAQYNGNITGTEWKSSGDAVNRHYDFTYDNVNRLLSADFKQVNPDGSFNNSIVNYNLKMGVDGANYSTAYDANGNIKQMQQWGLKINASTQIDNLTYNYTTNSNKLLNVIDASNDNTTRLGDFRASALYQQTTPAKTNTTVDYNYDVNGNLTKDRNKDIITAGGADGIQYNFLNLPAVITVKKDAASNKGTITYTYDAAGSKLKKVTLENVTPAKTITTTTCYISGFVYESKITSPADPNSPDYTDVLQFIPHEEGRIRFKPAVGAAAGAFTFDYFIKDHLGNVRMVLTDEVQQDKYPVASMEDAKLSTEQQYYTIDNTRIVLKTAATGLPAYTNDNGIGNNPSDPTFEAAASNKLYQLNSNTNKTGLGITLKVMAGDKIDVFGKSYYFTNTSGTGGNSTVPVIDLLTAFLSAPAAAATTAVHGAVTAATINTPTGITGINSMIWQQNTQSNAAINKPRAFINVVFFDEQFKSYDYRISMVGNNSAVKDHYSELQNLMANKSGYVYIYCSNESPVNVFFDNLQVVQTRGPILEETHYYPFGLTMAGISSKAVGTIQNKDKTFQGQRFDDELGLNWIQFKWRNHDPQIGRFIEIDPLAEDYVYNSTYAFSENKVTNHIELEGLEAVPLAPQVWQSVQETARSCGPYGKAVIAVGAVATALAYLWDAMPSQAEIDAANTHNATVGAGVFGGNSYTMGTTGDDRSVPNPNGKKGGEAHQNKVNEAEKKMQEKGMETKREVEVKTPGGTKEKRYIDVEGKDPKTGKTEQVQVGKENKNGTPVSRERKALDDVEKATGVRPTFVPYKPASPPAPSYLPQPFKQ